MPGKIKVRILSGRNLPVMDRSSDTTDAYVEIKFGNTTYKTDVCRKSLNPQWNSEWYRFEVDDSELQDEPLQIKLMDHDTYSANDAIGKVYVNLNPLLLPGVPPPVKNIWTLEATMNSSIGAQGGSVMTGWVPVFDTMHGIRGEVNIIVKVELFLDFNKFRQSSCGVQFFYSPNIPFGYHAQVVHGFVEELIVSDDPEYKWIDKIRTPRASNEARQTLFFKLSGEVQRKIGLKALDLGGNAVIGYLQNFDLEGESGIVARGIGTAVTLVKVQEVPNVLSEGPTVEELATLGSKFKKHADNPDSDDSTPLLSHSPLTPNASPTNMYMTLINQKFPYYGRTTPKNPRTLMKVIDCRNQLKDSSRPLSLPYNVNSKKMQESSLSLSDDIIDESSIRNLLALEDLRGESSGNRFSRSLKNLKYLQQNVLSKRVNQFRSKMSESFDEESDGDSISSSTWSIGGTDSTRSSVLDLRKNTRNKSFSRSKSANDGMVALLIKSVHTGFPASLDIVKEDRETPAPSPVKFLVDGSDSMKIDTENVEKSSSDNTEKIFPTLDINAIDNKYNHDFSIPMISSSETDTSSEDDEPSESSTNYNILDDTSSLNELVLPSRRVSNKIKSKKGNSLRIDEKNELTISRKDSLQTDGSTSTEPTSSDVDSDFHDKFEKQSRISPNRNVNQILPLDNSQNKIDTSNIKFELEIPFKKLEEDKDSLKNESFDLKVIDNVERNNFQENPKLKDSLNEPLLFFGHLENSEEIQDEIDISNLASLENKHIETISLIGPEEIESYNSSLLNDKNFETIPIIDAEEIEDYNFPLLEIQNSESITIIRSAENNLPLLEDKNTSIAIDQKEIEDNIFHKNDKSIECYSTSDDEEEEEEEEENEVFNEHFFQENRSMESVIMQPEKFETRFLNDEESSIKISEVINEPLFNNKNNETNLKTDIFDEPFFQDKNNLQFGEFSQTSKILNLESNQKDKIKNEIFNEPFFKDNENYALTVFHQEDKHFGKDDIKSNKNKETNEAFKNIPFDLKNISNSKTDFKEQENFIYFENTNEEKSEQIKNSPLHLNESFSFPTLDLSQNNNNEKLKIPTNLVQSIIDNDITNDNLKIKSENQIMEKRKSLKRQNSQYEENNIMENIIQHNESIDTKISELPLENSNSLKKLNTKKESEEKNSRGVERSDTVIYKGPLDEKGRPLTPKIEKRQSKESTTSNSNSNSPIPIFVEHYSEKTNFLKVPIAHTLDVNVKSTYTKKETELAENIIQKSHQDDELKYAEILRHKFRKSSMLDLMKIIDTKMMVHTSHHSSSHRKDSFRCTKKRRDKIFKNLTPSPDSIQKIRIHKRRSKSKSPEISPNGKFPSTSTLNSLHTSHHSNHHHHYHSVKKHVTHNLPSLENTFKHTPDNSQIVPNANFMKDNLSKNFDDIHKIVVDKLAIDMQNNELNNSNNNFQLHELKSDHLKLTPKIVESSLEESSVCNLDKPLNELVELTKNTNAAVTDNLCVSHSPPHLRQQDENSTSPVHANINNSLMGKSSQLNNTKTNPAIPLHRRSSDSDLSITPKGNSLASSDRSMGGYLKPTTAIRTMNQDASDMLEYPFLTMQQYPPGFILHIGGLVSARSVKLLERISNLEEPEGRDAWWTEIRMEVRSHARALACNVVIGYREETSISDDVCVLNASGTAAVINLHNINQDLDSSFVNRQQQGMAASIDSDREKTQQKGNNNKNDKNDNETTMTNQTNQTGKIKRTSESNDHEIPYSLPLSNCSLCHLPYSESSVPFKVNITKCAVCRRAKVPDVLFTTIELPDNVPVTGRGCFVQAIVCKCKKDLRGELNAKEISDCLPFLEYELHSLLLNKLKVKGMNSIFGLKVQVSVGERLIIGMAIGTGVYLTSLPTPSLPQIASGNSWNNEEQLNEIQKNLMETVKKNREFYKLKSTDTDNGRSRSDTDESDDDLPDMDLSLGTKDACVLEVDDVEDMDRICLLMDDTPPDDFHVVNTQSIPGLEDLEIVRNLQMFTQVSRAKIPSGQFGSMPSKYFARLLQTVYFKLRRMVPCALCDMKFRVALPEQDEIQLSVVGMALGLGESSKHSKHKRKLMTYSSSKDQLKKSDDCDMIFTLDEDVAEIVPTATNEVAINPQNSLVSSQKTRPRSPLRIKSHTMHRHKHVPLKERYGVDITPLSYLPGGRIERYLGNLNFFFIRESTSIRENGGISGFTHSFVNEVLAIVRAHVTSLGGNAMVAFFMTQCVLLHSPHKNHGQCLINVGGDVVSVSYFGDERQIGNTIC